MDIPHMSPLTSTTYLGALDRYYKKADNNGDNENTAQLHKLSWPFAKSAIN